MAEAEKVGSYVLDRELGRGGMGAVYAAVHQLLGRRAAVKLLLPDLSRKQDLVQRFFNEAKAASAIKHPSIVDIYDYGFAADGSAYIVMELLEGETLAARLKARGPMPVPQAVVVARQVANALGAAHAAGIVHRDLKPDNIYLVKDPEVAGGERVKLLDFGIAKLATDTKGTSRTVTGAILGTPHYMSPEQCEGAREVDLRTDLYSLGCMLFQMLSGVLPFDSPGVGGLIGMHLHVPPPLLRAKCPWASPELEAVVARLLAKTPEERFATAEALALALSAPGVSVVGDATDLSRAPTDLARASSGLGSAETVVTPSAPMGPGTTGGRKTTELDRAGRAETLAATDPEVARASGGAGLSAPKLPTGAGPVAAGKGRIERSDDATVPSMPPVMDEAADLGSSRRTTLKREPGRARGRGGPTILVFTVVVVLGGVMVFFKVGLDKNAAPPGGDTRVVEIEGSVDAELARPTNVSAGPAPVAQPSPPSPPPSPSRGEELAAAEATLDAMKLAEKSGELDTVEQLHARLLARTTDEGMRKKADAVLEAAKRAALGSAVRTIAKLAKRRDCKQAEAVAKAASARFGEDARKKIAPMLKGCKPIEPPGRSRADEDAEIEAKIRESASAGRWMEAVGLCGQMAVVRNGPLLRVCIDSACEARNEAMFKVWSSFLLPQERDAALRQCPYVQPDPVPERRQQRKQGGGANAPNAPVKNPAKGDPTSQTPQPPSEAK